MEDKILESRLKTFCDRLKEDRVTHLAVVGSRAFDNTEECSNRGRELVNSHLHYIVSHTRISTVVTGGARGIDTFAEDFARGHDALNDPVVKDAKWKEEGKGAGMIRNVKVVEDSQALIAFILGPSPGTRDVVKQAKRRGLPVLEVEVLL